MSMQLGKTRQNEQDKVVPPCKISLTWSGPEVTVPILVQNFTLQKARLYSSRPEGLP